MESSATLQSLSLQLRNQITNESKAHIIEYIGDRCPAAQRFFPEFFPDDVTPPAVRATLVAEAPAAEVVTVAAVMPTEYDATVTMLHTLPAPATILPDAVEMFYTVPRALLAKGWSLLCNAAGTAWGMLSEALFTTTTVTEDLHAPVDAMGSNDADGEIES